MSARASLLGRLQRRESGRLTSSSHLLPHTGTRPHALQRVVAGSSHTVQGPAEAVAMVARWLSREGERVGDESVDERSRWRGLGRGGWAVEQVLRSLCWWMARAQVGRRRGELWVRSSTCSASSLMAKSLSPGQHSFSSSFACGTSHSSLYRSYWPLGLARRDVLLVLSRSHRSTPLSLARDSQAQSRSASCSSSAPTTSSRRAAPPSCPARPRGAPPSWRRARP